MHPPQKINTVIVRMSCALSMSTSVTSLSCQQSTSALVNVRLCQYAHMSMSFSLSCRSLCQCPTPCQCPSPSRCPTPCKCVSPCRYVPLPVNVPFSGNARSLSMSYQFAAPVNVTPSVNMSKCQCVNVPLLALSFAEHPQRAKALCPVAAQ